MSQADLLSLGTAGAAPAQSAESVGFRDLPPDLHLHVLSFLPFVGRVRCALVSRRWAALLADPAFWEELRFDEAAEGSVGTETLLQLFRRARGRARVLDVSSSACNAVSFTEDFFSALAAERLGASLESLHTWAPAPPIGPPSYSPSYNRPRAWPAAASAALRAACPALASAAVEVAGSGAEVVATLSSMPGPGHKRVSVSSLSYSNGPDPCFSTLTDWLPAALAASSVAELVFDRFHFAIQAGRDDAAAAASAIADALAAPGRGVRALRLDFCRGSEDTPLVGGLCRALTAESPLEELDLSTVSLTDSHSADIATALAPGRSRLRILACMLDNARAGGAAALCASLGANTTLTELSVYGPPADALAALSASLRANATLRTLSLSYAHVSGGGLGRVFAALSGSELQPSRSAVTSLDCTSCRLDPPECAVLGESLSRGASLEALSLDMCRMGPGGMTAIFGWELALPKGQPSRLKLFRLALDRDDQDEGARGTAKPLTHFGVAETACAPPMHQNGSWAEIGSASSYQGAFRRPFCPPESGATVLGKVLAEPGCSLEKLHFSSSYVSDAGGVLIARGLEAASAASRLQVLNLSENKLGVAAAAALGRALAAQGSGGALRELHLGANRIGPKGAQALAEGLRENASLEKLDLNFNRMGVDGAAAVAAGIAGPDGVGSAVKHLSIAGNGVGGAGVEAMLQAGLARNATLTELDLQANDITYSGWQALACWVGERFGVVPEKDSGEDQSAPGEGGAEPGDDATLLSGGARGTTPGCAPPLQQPRPLTLRLTSYVGLGQEGQQEKAAFRALESVAERANVAAAARGWPTKGGSALRIVVVDR